MSDWSFYDRGFSLFPLTPRTKSPALESWEPYQTQRATPELVASWAAQTGFNTGVATGTVSDCIVLDADGLMARTMMEAQGLPDTLTVATPRGWHFYFQHPGWEVKNRAGRGWTKDLNGGEGFDGWDLRGDGGYVVGPGSYYHPTPAEAAKGKVAGWYRIERDVPVAPAPDWLLALVFPKARKENAQAKIADVTSDYGRAALNSEFAVLTSAREGEVNQRVNDSAFAIGQLVGGGEITVEEGWGALQEALAVLGIQDEEKAQGTLERGWTAGMEAPRAVEHHERVSVTPEQALGTRAPVAPPPPGPDGQIVAAAPPPPVEPSTALVRGQTIWHDDMDALFANCWFVQMRDAVFVKGMGVLSPTSFDTLKGGFEFPTTIEGSKKTRSAWDAFRLSPSWKCPWVFDVCFRPDRTPGAVIDIEGLPYINSYQPITTKRIAGDPSKFVDLLRKLFPIQRDYDIITTYMASLVQNVGRKFQWWPVIQGVQGNGKTLILTVLQHAVGKRYTYLIDPEVLGKTANQFNSWVQGNLLVGVEEIFVSDQRHILETFKPIVTNARTRVEKKGKDATTGDNYCNGVMLTNHKNGVPVTDRERRYAIFFTPQQDAEDLARDGMDGGYFPDLYDWLHGRGAYAHLGEDYGLAVVNDWLHGLARVAEFDPAALCQRAPATSSRAEAVRESLGTLEQEVLEAVEEQRVGFKGGWVSSHALRNLFQSLRMTIGPKRYRSLMAAVGYVPHPSLADGRVTNPLNDGTRPRLYVAKGTPEAALPAADVPAAFEAAQTGTVAVAQGNVVHLRPR